MQDQLRRRCYKLVAKMMIAIFSLRDQSPPSGVAINAQGAALTVLPFIGNGAFFPKLNSRRPLFTRQNDLIVAL